MFLGYNTNGLAHHRLTDAVELLAEIGYRAACSLDDHAVKLAEACLREDAAAPDPGLRLAAADAALHLGGPQRSC